MTPTTRANCLIFKRFNRPGFKKYPIKILMVC